MEKRSRIRKNNIYVQTKMRLIGEEVKEKGTRRRRTRRELSKMLRRQEGRDDKEEEGEDEHKQEIDRTRRKARMRAFIWKGERRTMDRMKKKVDKS